MSELFNVTHELGTLDEYDSTVVDGGDLSAHADGALAGTSYGLKCVIDDTTGIYGVVNISPPASNQLRVRFYVDPNGITMGDWESFYLMFEGPNSGFENIAARFYSVSGNYRMSPGVRDDGNIWRESSSVAISDAPHYIEFHLVRATSDVASDGYVDWWIDGAAQTRLANIDNYDGWSGITDLRFGAVSSLDAGTSGTLYLDELRANDDGSEIGVAVAAEKDGIRAMVMGMSLVGT